MISENSVSSTKFTIMITTDILVFLIFPPLFCFFFFVFDFVFVSVFVFVFKFPAVFLASCFGEWSRKRIVTRQ